MADRARRTLIAVTLLLGVLNALPVGEASGAARGPHGARHRPAHHPSKPFVVNASAGDSPRHPPVYVPPDYCHPFRIPAPAAKAARAGTAPTTRSLSAPWTRAPHRLVDPHARYTLAIAISGPGVRDRGTVVVALDARHATDAVNTLIFLACNGYYDGALVDRVIPGRLVEGGAPRPGTTPGPLFPAAAPPAIGAYTRGVVALCGDSQADGRFFIPLERLELPARYTIVGNVTAGLAVLERLSRAPATLQPDAQEATLPLTPIRFASLALHVDAAPHRP